MAFGMKEKPKLLDPKLCFEAWITTNSVYKSPQYLYDKYGIIQPKTGKLVTHQAVWLSAWTYALENIQEAKQKAEEISRANGVLLDDTQYFRSLVKRAKRQLSPKKYDEFIKNHSYLTQYQEN